MNNPEPIFVKCDCKRSLVPHFNIMRGEDRLNAKAILSVYEGSLMLNAMLEGRGVSREEFSRLSDQLEELGLPYSMTRQEMELEETILVNTTLMAFYRPDKVADILEEAVLTGEISEYLATKIQDRIAGLSDDEKIALGVDALAAVDLDQPMSVAMLQTNVDPRLAPKLLEAARAKQNELLAAQREKAMQVMLDNGSFLNEAKMTRMIYRATTTGVIKAADVAEFKDRVTALSDDEKVQKAILTIKGTLDPNSPDAGDRLLKVVAAPLVPAVLSGLVEAENKQKLEALLQFSVSNFGFYNQAALERALATAIEEQQLSLEEADLVREKVATLSDDEKVNLAAEFLRYYDVDDEATRRFLGDNVDPRLITRVSQAARDKQENGGNTLRIGDFVIDAFLVSSDGRVQRL